MTEKPNNKNSKYRYYNRVIIRFPPIKHTQINDPQRYLNQFYTKIKLQYLDEISGQKKNYFDIYNLVDHAKVKEYEHQIDLLVYKLYELSYNEVETLTRGLREEN